MAEPEYPWRSWVSCLESSSTNTQVRSISVSCILSKTLALFLTKVSLSEGDRCVRHAPIWNWSFRRSSWSRVPGQYCDWKSWLLSTCSSLEIMILRRKCWTCWNRLVGQKWLLAGKLKWDFTADIGRSFTWHFHIIFQVPLSPWLWLLAVRGWHQHTAELRSSLRQVRALEIFLITSSYSTYSHVRRSIFCPISGLLPSWLIPSSLWRAKSSSTPSDSSTPTWWWATNKRYIWGGHMDAWIFIMTL